jgi:hypothetical protein
VEYVVIDDRAMMAIIRESPDMLDDWMEDEVCAKIVEEIQDSFNSGPPGRRYSYGVASSPGYPPNDYTGALKESYHYSKNREGEYIIADGVPYGIYLEYGTSKMAPRPHVRPVIEDWRRNKMVRSFMDVFSGPSGRFSSITARYARMRRA